MIFSLLEYIYTFFQVESLEKISIDDEYVNVSNMLPPLDGKIFALNIKQNVFEKHSEILNQGTNGSIEEYSGKNIL